VEDEPAPGALSIPITPPISSTSSWQIARPRPEPSWARVTDASTCENFWNNRPWLSAAMPIPVSLTSKRHRQSRGER
jgi:hypothetical protein